MPRMSTTQKIAVGLTLPLDGFVPPDISGLKLWLDSSDTSTVYQDAAKTTPAGDTDVVGAWTDKSGQGNDATQAVTAAKPIYHTGVLNSLPVVRFAGDDYLEKTAFTGGAIAQPTTMIVVIKLSLANANFQMAIGGTNAVNRQSVYKQAAPSEWAMYAGAEYASGISTDLSWHIISCVFKGAASFLRVDGVQAAAGDASNAGQVGIKVGTHQTNNFFWNGDEAEILLYDKELSIAELLALELYESNKWEIAVS